MPYATAERLDGTVFEVMQNKGDGVWSALPPALTKKWGEVDVAKLTPALIDQVKAAPNEAAAEIAAAAVILGE